MRKNYKAPQLEVVQLSSELMQGAIGVVHHSGGGGFDESQIY